MCPYIRRIPPPDFLVHVAFISVRLKFKGVAPDWDQLRVWAQETFHGEYPVLARCLLGFSESLGYVTKL